MNSGDYMDEELLGLTEEEAVKLEEDGKNNFLVFPPSKTKEQIIKENVFTYFNFVFLFLAVLLLLVGAFRDMLFLGIIICNTLIGIFQELRAKKVLDNLQMINVPTAMVRREGKTYEISTENLVLGDIVEFSSGNQICADAVVVKGKVSVNESLLTGEADEIKKEKDDQLLSGSFIVSGKCYAKLTKVGADSYISKLTLQAKREKTIEQSEIIRSLNKIVLFAGIIIIPIGATLFYQSFFLNGETIKASVQSMVASILGMIPEGLFLLSSITLALSAMRLANKKVMLHDMKSIETLARVDVLCVDKTGTITNNEMKVEDFEVIDKTDKDVAFQILSNFAKAQAKDNITMSALKEFFNRSATEKSESVISFSSEFKYSAVNFASANYVLGAPEFVLGNHYDQYKEKIEKHSKAGKRVLVFGTYPDEIDGKKLTKKVTPMALVLLSNPIRENAKETFQYFYEQGVEIKVISGDNPVTVSEIAKAAGIHNVEKYVDASTLQSDQDIEKAMENFSIFGRVTPDQKRKFIKALQKQGHTVAMTGDGVNDVLALKDADCSVAMASGSQAACEAAQVVLLESDFSRMPEVVREGRQVVNNLERSGSLFLVKNIFSLLTSILAIYFGIKYPLLPAQISLVSTFTIAIPAFFLSQIPNQDIIKGHFMLNIIRKAIPGGITDTIMVCSMTAFGLIFGLNSNDISTSAAILLAIIGLMVLLSISKPMNIYKWAIFILNAAAIVFCLIYLRDWFSITNTMSLKGLLLCINFSIMTEAIFRYVSGIFNFFEKLFQKNTTKKGNA
ncbi:MAG: HAD-IC family P-type ATPase [Bacilli bacterium]|nr:HAD-IC family P-type ATPase [Bacilli bacterium]